MNRRNFIINTAFIGGISSILKPSLLASTLSNETKEQNTEWGILDLTQKPYLADKTGKKDSTKAIQEAINNARDEHLIVYFPAGTYLVSDTLILNQQGIRSEDRELRRDESPCVLWGEDRGAGRAKIILSDNAKGFNDPGKPKPVIYSLSFNTVNQVTNPYVSYNQMIISLDVDLGKGNTGAMGVDHQGAQGTLTEDVHVNAEGAFAGFRGTSGSGGSVSHISVKGGQYGLYLEWIDPISKYAGSQPSPVISAVKLTGQTKKSIYSGVRGPLTLVGACIEGPRIYLAGSHGYFDGALNVIDSQIQYKGEGPIITGNRPVYMSNVFVNKAETVTSLEGTIPLKGSADDWIHITEYAVSPSDQYPIWINGNRSLKPLVSVEIGKSPSSDPAEPHIWNEALPQWNSQGVINVREAPYLAKGDGKTDDWSAIQSALNEHDDVFLPKGVYRISKPLKIRAKTRFFGTGVYSKIEALPDAPAYSDPGNASPMLISPNDKDANCIVAFIDLWCRHTGSYAMHWQSGRHSMARNVRTWPMIYEEGTEKAQHPMILIDGNGGGRWYNTVMHERLPQAANHRHVLVRGTREPLRFYMLNSEHSEADYMVEFDDVSNLIIYAVKAETSLAQGVRALTPYLIRNSRNFRIYGYGGNAAPEERKALYQIENCHDFTLTNFSHQPSNNNPDYNWFMLEEKTSDGKIFQLPKTDLFTLYLQK
jgi:Pectate lyase superfamily protein